MEIEIFVISFGFFLALLFRWSFNTLPKEKWQIIGAIPVNKTLQGDWNGINFTYYGFFNACACTLAAAIFLLLLGTLDIPLKITVVFFTILMAICMPAARIIAYLVEKKRYTFSIGGASFVGMIVAPWLIVILTTLFKSWAEAGIQVITVLAAISIAYAFGEGIGRLACISFGCCYGRPLATIHPLLQKIFKDFNFVFNGDTRKCVYADGLAGIQVIPIQALTAVLYCSAGLISLYIFLKSHFMAAFLICILVTQIWRLGSEFLRADYRGTSRISKYQLMACFTIVYSVALALLFRTNPDTLPSIASGLLGLWQPVVIILLQLLWIVVFVYTGKSDVTGAQISFHVNQERI
jgi:prolipoprotein diacylglyceryltransferase